MTATIDTHAAQQAGLAIEWRDPNAPHRPRRDMVKIMQYLKLRAERARRARLTQANPTGPRHDEWPADNPRPVEVRNGTVNPCATGPAPVEYAPKGGKWVPYGMNGAERWIPDPAPVYRVVEKQKPASTPIHKVGCAVAIGTDGRLRDLNNCGPIGTPWVDPAAKK